jgi:integrase/recombinase XerD
MTQENNTKTYDYLPAFYDQLHSHGRYFNLMYSPEPVTSFPLHFNPKNLFPRDCQWQREYRLGLDQALQKLSAIDLNGKDHIESYLRDQHRRNLKPRTLTNALKSIASFMLFIQKEGKNHIEEITKQDIEGWIEQEQDRGMKASTVNLRLGTLKAFLRFLMEEDVVPPGLLSKRMMIKVPEPLPRAMDPDDVRQLLAVLEDVRDRAMILVLLRTGMRIGELLNTILEDVNLKEKRIEIYEAGKTRAGRVVYLSDDALQALKAWLAVRDPSRTYLFYSQGKNSNTITYPAVRMIFVKHLKKAGLSHKGYTLHCLRHTCASELLNAGMRLECVQQLLGHSTVEMTRRYARLTDKTREEEYFRAMNIIERGKIHGHYQLDSELSSFFEEA